MKEQHNMRLVFLVGSIMVASMMGAAQAPDVPVSLPPTNVTDFTFTANWQAAANATGYMLEVKVFYPFNQSGQPIFNLPLGNVLSYDFPSLPAQGCRIEYRVVGTNGGSQSSFSSTQNFYLSPPMPPPGLGYPMPCSYEVGQTYFNIIFSLTYFFDNPNNGTSGFLVEVALDQNFTQPIPGSPFTGSFPGTPAAVTGLTPGASYYVHYAFTNPGGVSAFQPLVFTVTTVPATPVISASSTSGSVTATWPTVPGATSYRLDVSKDNFTNFLVGYNDLTVNGTTSYTISGLDPLTNYQVRVRSKSECNPSPNSNVVSISTLAVEPVAQPTALTFSNFTTSGFSASFTPATGSPTGYLALIREGSSPTETPADGTGYTAGQTIGSSTVAYVGSSTTFSVTGLNTATSYFFDVFSFNGSTGYNYVTSSPLEGSTSTVSTEPTAQPTNLSFSNVTASAIKVSFTAATGATGYLALAKVGSAPTETPVDGINYAAGAVLGSSKVVYFDTGTTFTDAGLTTGTVYHYAVFAVNGSANTYNYLTTSPLVGSQSTSSSAPIAIGTLTFSSKQDNATTQTLNIAVTGGKAPYTVEFKHKGILEDTFTSSMLTPTSPGTYSFALAPAMLDKIGVAFEVIATDANGDTDKKTGEIHVAFSEAQSPPLAFEKFGGTDETWNLFSIPYELDNKSISSLFSGYDPDRYEYDWKIMRYRTGSNDYVNFNTGQVKLGEAYWFNAKESVSLKVGAGQTAAQVPFILSLARGWNLIGNPYTIGISWNKVLAANSGVTGIEALQVFNGSAQSAGDVIAPFGGGFVWSDGDTQVSIDPVVSASSGRIAPPTKKIESEDIDNSEWMISLSLSGNQTDLNVGGVGMHPQAAEQKDRYDAMTVPRFMLYSDLVSEHPDFFYSRFSVDVVPTQSKYTWSFTLASNQIKGVSQLVWDQTALQGKRSGLYLFDKSAGILVDMAQRSNYPVDLGRGNFKFEIYYSATGEPFVPKDVLLGDAWPNPATESVNIPIALPRTSQAIDLSVYDMTGKRVATVAYGIYPAGTYTFQWDASGDSRAGGLYIYRLTFQDGAAPIQKKLILR